MIPTHQLIICFVMNTKHSGAFYDWDISESNLIYAVIITHCFVSCVWLVMWTRRYSWWPVTLVEIASAASLAVILSVYDVCRPGEARDMHRFASGCTRLTVGDTVIRQGFGPPAAQCMISGCSFKDFKDGWMDKWILQLCVTSSIK